jgi:outer membrane protein assembly factor BamA
LISRSKYKKLKKGTGYLFNWLILIFITQLPIPQATAQNVPAVQAPNKYPLVIHLTGKDSSDTNQSENLKSLHLTTIFNTKLLCMDYVDRLPAILLNKGYPAASVDSFVMDSTKAFIELYLGQKYKWAQIKTDSADMPVLKEAGWKPETANSTIDFSELGNRQQRILNYYEKSGYPFAEIRLDSITIDEDKINGTLKIHKGVLYHIDSIRLLGKVKIKNSFIQHYLGISKGDAYNKEKLDDISKRLMELPFLQEQRPWDLNMFGTGATLNLYLLPKRSSQVNFLIGFLPSTTQEGKTQLTGDVNLDLKNSLGSGENILLNWQQLQKKSPRLVVGYQHPYIFNSSFGIDLSFNLLKRDSTYLQLNTQLGLQYILSSTQSGKIFFQNERAYLLQGGFDTNQVKITRKLPQDVDVSSSSIGLNYEWVNTNYRLNPLSGNEVKVTTTVGLKKITKNNDILNLSDPSDPGFKFSSLYDTIKLKSYQLRLNTAVAHYWQVGQKSTLKTAVSVGILESQNTFRNELFRIGGYKLLRGFDEESIYASSFSVFTVEYRYLVGVNSYLFAFTDVGLTKTRFLATDFSNTLTGAGLGLAFETKFGLLNVSYALGKRNDVKFNIREASKIHFGYVNYF